MRIPKPVKTDFKKQVDFIVFEDLTSSTWFIILFITYFQVVIEARRETHDPELDLLPAPLNSSNGFKCTTQVEKLESTVVENSLADVDISEVIILLTMLIHENLQDEEYRNIVQLF